MLYIQYKTMSEVHGASYGKKSQSIESYRDAAKTSFVDGCLGFYCRPLLLNNLFFAAHDLETISLWKFSPQFPQSCINWGEKPQLIAQFSLFSLASAQKNLQVDCAKSILFHDSVYITRPFNS